MSLHDGSMLLATFIVAAMYSAVGHGGASGYLAILSLAGVDTASMVSTALVLNILVATMSAVVYARAGHLNLKNALPYIVLSVPAAFVGGLTSVSPRSYAIFLIGALAFSAYRLAFRSGQVPGIHQITKPPVSVAVAIGALLGWVSGVIGIGGGIFLSPVLLFKGWASPQQTSAIASVFIVVNSLAGILGRISGGTFSLSYCAPLIASALIGGLLGSHLGANSFSRKTICKVLAAVLGIAIAKLALVVAH